MSSLTKPQYLMTDIVTNHMAYPGGRNNVNYTAFNPFNQKSQYHPPCNIDFTNIQSVETCWAGDDLVALADLRTEDPAIRDTWNKWITQMVAKFKIDGLRLDSALEVEPSFWPGFGKAAGVYQVGEVLNTDPIFVASYQPAMDGLLNYPLFFWITNAFASTGGSIKGLVDGLTALTAVPKIDLGLWGTFMENHDQVRFPSYTNDLSLVKNALTYTMLYDGIPIIYQGQEQHFGGGVAPNNREALWFSNFSTTAPLYGWIANLNAVRARAIAQDKNYLPSKAAIIHADQRTVAFRKGPDGAQLVSAYANVGAGNTFAFTLSANQTGFKAGDKLLELTRCNATTVGADGNLAVLSTTGEPLVYYPVAQLAGSGICTPVTGELFPVVFCLT